MPDQGPLVSVLLPVYNGVEYIAQAIKSILWQSYQNFELIIIDNGSDDGTEKEIQKFHDQRVIYHHLGESDLVKALNYGLELCKGKYIARMDADDYAYPHRLEKQVEFLETHPEFGLASGLVKYVGNEERNQGYMTYVNWANSQISSQQIFLSRFQESSLPHPSVMFKRSLIDEFGYYRSDCPEDFELWNRWMANGVKMGKLNELILDWHDPPYRLSRTHRNYDQDSFSRIKAHYFTRWFNEHFREKKPDIYIFGFGKIVRRKTGFLLKEGLEIKSYIDVVDSPKPNCIHYSQLPGIPNKFVLSCVSDRQGKEEIREYLIKIGMTEGENFYMME